MERILSMIVRRLMNKGINHGIRAASRRGQNRQDDGGDGQQARRMNQQGQKNTKGLRQASRMMKRITKL